MRELLEAGPAGRVDVPTLAQLADETRDLRTKVHELEAQPQRLRDPARLTCAHCRAATTSSDVLLRKSGSRSRSLTRASAFVSHLTTGFAPKGPADPSERFGDPPLAPSGGDWRRGRRRIATRRSRAASSPSSALAEVHFRGQGSHAGYRGPCDPSSGTSLMTERLVAASAAMRSSRRPRGDGRFRPGAYQLTDRG